MIHSTFDFLEMFKKNYRYCEYSHCYYCVRCHTNQLSPLPSRMIHHWDFKMYPVANVCKQYLDCIADQPVVCLAAVNPLMFDQVAELRELRELRLKLSYIYDYVKLCKEYAELEKRLTVFHQAFCDLWHKENKPQGWEVQDARLGGLMQRLATCRKRLQVYLAGELDKIDELEEEILPHGNGQNLQHNFYCGAISMSPM